MSGSNTLGHFQYEPSSPMEGVECYWIQASNPIGSKGVGGMTDIASVNGPQCAEREAIANLFAAAPDLLWVLEALTGAAAATPNFASPLVLKSAHEAIAKARGDAWKRRAAFETAAQAENEQ